MKLIRLLLQCWLWMVGLVFLLYSLIADEPICAKSLLIFIALGELLALALQGVFDKILERDLARANNTLEGLIDKNSQRKIATDFIEESVAMLKRIAGLRVRVLRVAHDPEAESFSSNVAGVLRQGGLIFDKVEVMTGAEHTVLGTWIYGKIEDKENVERILEALWAVDVGAICRRFNHHDGPIQVFIGKKVHPEIMRHPRPVRLPDGKVGWDDPTFGSPASPQ